MSRSLLFHVFIYMCVYYVKRVNMSRSLLFHVFIQYICVYYVKRVNISSSTTLISCVYM